MRMKNPARGSDLTAAHFPQFFQEPFRHFAAFCAIEVTTEFLFVGMAATT